MSKPYDVWDEKLHIKGRKDMLTAVVNLLKEEISLTKEEQRRYAKNKLYHLAYEKGVEQDTYEALIEILDEHFN